MASSLKFVALVGLLAVWAYEATATATAAAERDQTVIWGESKPYNRLLYTEKVDVPGTIFMVHERDVRYPTHSTSLAGGTIHQIKIIDQAQTGKNGEVTIAKGGLGMREAVVHIRSKRGKSIRYLVEFHGV